MRSRTVLAYSIVVSSLTAMTLIVYAKPPTMATNGQYDVTFAGDYVGHGKAVVGSTRVNNITGNLRDQVTGAVGHFVVTNLPTDNGHFTGTGTVIGVSTTVCGRVEPADGITIFKPRIIINFITNGDECGRAFGSR